MHPVVNIQHLTKYHHSQDNTRNILENPRDQLRSSEEYKVEKIVAERRRGNKTFYLIQWKGYNSKNDSWQTAWDLRNAPDIICEWCRQLRQLNHVTALIASRVTSATDIFLTVIHHLISNSSSSIPIKMSSSMTAPNAHYATYQSEHTLLGHRITFDYSLSSLVPTHEGGTSGYFDDSTTHTLLGLKEDDQVMHSGTYGLKEPGAEPVALSLL